MIRNPSCSSQTHTWQVFSSMTTIKVRGLFYIYVSVVSVCQLCCFCCHGKQNGLRVLIILIILSPTWVCWRQFIFKYASYFFYLLAFFSNKCFCAHKWINKIRLREITYQNLWQINPFALLSAFHSQVAHKNDIFHIHTSYSSSNLWATYTPVRKFYNLSKHAKWQKYQALSRTTSEGLVGYVTDIRSTILYNTQCFSETCMKIVA